MEGYAIRAIWKIRPMIIYPYIKIYRGPIHQFPPIPERAACIAATA